jgi:hypothetical protein
MQSRGLLFPFLLPARRKGIKYKNEDIKMNNKELTTIFWRIQNKTVT